MVAPVCVQRTGRQAATIMVAQAATIIIARPSRCPELAVARIAQAWDDVAVLIQVVVNRCQMDGDIGVGFLHGGDALRRADQAHELDLLHPPALQDVGGGDGRAAGRQHWVQDEADGDSRLDGQLIVVFRRLERPLVADCHSTLHRVKLKRY